MKALKFPLRIVGGKMASTSDYNEIVRNQLIDSVMTNFGERVMRPEYGADVQSLLFDPADELRTSDMAVILKERLTFMVPRATIEEITVNSDIGVPNVVNVDIRYRVNSYDNEQVLTVPVQTRES